MGSSKKIATSGINIIPTSGGSAGLISAGLELADSGGKLAFNSVKLADADDVTSVDSRVLTEKTDRDGNIEGRTLSGTVTMAEETLTTVTGTSTKFDEELHVGSEIKANGETRTVTAIASATALTVDAAFTAAAAQTAYEVGLDATVLAEKTTRDTKITSLDARVLAEKTTRDTKVSSLDARVLAEQTTRDTKIDSLDSRVLTEKTDRDGNIEGRTLSGTVTMAEETLTTVTGTSTKFDEELHVGSEIKANGETRTVTAIASATALTVDAAFTAAAAQTAYEVGLDATVLAEKTTRDTKITSLDARVLAEKTTRDTKVSSLDARLEDEEDGMSYSTITLSSADGNGGNGLVNVTYSMTNVPAIAGTIRQKDGSGPILSCMLVGTPTSTAATFQLSANTPDADGSSDYYLDLIMVDDLSTTD